MSQREVISCPKRQLVLPPPTPTSPPPPPPPQPQPRPQLQPLSLTNVATSSTGSSSSVGMETVKRRLDERIRNLPKNKKQVESFYAIIVGREPGIYISR